MGRDSQRGGRASVRLSAGSVAENRQAYGTILWRKQTPAGTGLPLASNCGLVEPPSARAAPTESPRAHRAATSGAPIMPSFDIPDEIGSGVSRPHAPGRISDSADFVQAPSFAPVSQDGRPRTALPRETGQERGAHGLQGLSDPRSHSERAPSGARSR